MNIKDAYGSLYLQVMGELCGDSIMGMKAEDLKVIQNNRDDDPSASQLMDPAFRSFLDGKQFERGTFLVRAKVD